MKVYVVNTQGYDDTQVFSTHRAAVEYLSAEPDGLELSNQCLLALGSVDDLGYTQVGWYPDGSRATVEVCEVL